MAKRPTLKDVAQAAGVSIATVNRVVAADPRVRQDTAQRVARAASDIGYHGHTLMTHQVKNSLPSVTLGFVLHKERQTFYQDFANAIEHAAAENPHARIKVVLEFCQSQSPQDVSEIMMTLSRDVDALAATAVNHHKVGDAVAQLRQKNIKCYSLLSDFAQGHRETYFGLNNLKVGRGVASALTKFASQSGDIALFVGGHRWHGHELRETGFRSQFRETGGAFRVLDTMVNLETRQLTYEAMLDLLARAPDLRGIYLAGGGMEGAIQALREEVAPHKIAMIVNEMTPQSASAMDEGYVSMVVGTPLQQMCQSLVETMVGNVLGQDVSTSGQVFFAPTLYLPEFQ